MRMAARQLRGGAALTAVAVLVGLTGCGTTTSVSVVRPCEGNTFFWSASSNVVVLPISLFGPASAQASADELSAALQLNVFGAVAQHPGIKVVRYQQGGPDQPICSAARVMRSLSECKGWRAMGGPSMTIIGGEPVLLLWANTLLDGDDLVIQLNLRYWRSSRRDGIELLLEEAVGSPNADLLRADLPSRQIAFSPRRVRLADLSRAGYELATLKLHADPRAEAPLLSADRYLRQHLSATGRVVTEASGRRYMEIMTPAHATAWTPLPIRTSFSDRFPELIFVELVTTYMEYLREDVPRPELVSQAVDALDRLRVAQASIAEGAEPQTLEAARELVMSLKLLDGLRRDDRSLLATVAAEAAGHENGANRTMRNTALVARYASRFGVHSGLRRTDMRFVSTTTRDVEWLRGQLDELLKTADVDATDLSSYGNAVTIATLLSRGMTDSNAATRYTQLVQQARVATPADNDDDCESLLELEPALVKPTPTRDSPG